MYIILTDDDLVEGVHTFSIELVVNTDSNVAAVSNTTTNIVIYDDDGELM